jgi:hypothetical protein
MATQCTLFRKIAKGFSLQTIKLTIEKKKTEVLEKQFEAVRPRKRRKV